MGSRNKLKAVEEYGQRYVREYLAEAKSQRDAIAGDPLTALAFMHGKLFMRGRRDEISVAFRDRTREVLARYGSLEEIDLRVLEEELVGNRVNNRYDRRMVRESVGFARDQLVEHDRNVFTWAVDAIRRGEVAAAYNALQDIFAVADKLATFYLRDVTLVEGIEDCIMPGDYPYVQPVDTWVEQVAGSLGLIDRGDRGKRSAIKRKIISGCLEAEVSPLLFNAGAWMVGAHAYRLLLDLL
jgi:hypothetical protein